MKLAVGIVAPTGRDAELIVELLRRSQIAAEPCKDLVSLLRENADGMPGAILIAEEALNVEAREALVEYLGMQPAWSDLPVLILTGTSQSMARFRGERFEKLGSLVLLPRPLRPDILISSIQAALRARERQYQIRDTLRERDNALAALEKEQQTLKVMIDNLPVGIMVAERGGEIIMANRTAEQILGKPLLGSLFVGTEALWHLFVPAGREGRPVDPRDYPLRRALETSRVVPPEDFLYRRGDGSLGWIRVAAAPILDQDGNVSGGVAAISDIDRDKRAEEALIKSEKLAAVGRLAASISHEINNPLEAVTNLLYLIEQGTQSTQVSEFAILAQKELARVSHIVTQTLRFHRQSSSPQRVGPKELLEPVIGLFRARMHSAGIQLDLQYRSGSQICCRDGDIRQVLSNLIGNAIDSMRGGGRLVVRTSSAHHPKGGIPGVRISIADTGHGIPKAAMGHIFEPFYTTKGDSGTGLGLWISQEIVTRNQGALKIRSRTTQPNSGTIASVFLPLGINAG